MNLIALENALLSTQPLIALRDSDSGECLIRLSRDLNDAPSGVLLVEIDYLYQLFGVSIAPRFYTLKETWSPEILVRYFVSRLAQECCWDIRNPAFGELKLIQSDTGLFTTFVGAETIAHGLIVKAGVSKFAFSTSVDFNPRCLVMLKDWHTKRLGMEQLPKPTSIGTFLPSRTIDLEESGLDGIFASIESAYNCCAQYGLTSSLLAECHTIVFKIPGNTKLISREFLKVLLKDTVGELSSEEYRARVLFVGFDKHRQILNDVLDQLLSVGVS